MFIARRAAFSIVLLALPVAAAVTAARVALH
jgi:hypothetical protein